MSFLDSGGTGEGIIDGDKERVSSFSRHFLYLA